MSQVRVHNFSISLDGFGTGDGLTLDAPFGHAGEPGGSTGVDHAFAEQNVLRIGAEIMGRGKFGPPQSGPWNSLGTDEEWRGWGGAKPPFHTPGFILPPHPR